MKKEAEITGERWDHSAEGYSDIILREFREVGDVWNRLLTENAPAGGKRALDIGTGPGFFAMVLAMNGFDATGVDCSPRMIDRARENARSRGLTVDFRVMDSHEMDFPDNTFDYITARNATWLLYDPEKAYREWLRVLKPGGRLLVLDANWAYKDDPEMTRKLDEAYKRYEEQQGRPFNSYKGSRELNEAFNALVAFEHVRRPEWDRDTLPKLGYRNIVITSRMNERIYPRWKQELYDAMDEFLVTAEKPE